MSGSSSSASPRRSSHGWRDDPADAILTAEAIAFDRTELEVPAGVDFPLLFENRESAPHNVTIVDATDRMLFVGEIFGGPASRAYEIGPLPAGTYQFRCDVHPEMSGTVIARQPSPDGSTLELRLARL